MWSLFQTHAQALFGGPVHRLATFTTPRNLVHTIRHARSSASHRTRPDSSRGRRPHPTDKLYEGPCTDSRSRQPTLHGGVRTGRIAGVGRGDAGPRSRDRRSLARLLSPRLRVERWLGCGRREQAWRRSAPPRHPHCFRHTRAGVECNEETARRTTLPGLVGR